MKFVLILFVSLTTLFTSVFSQNWNHEGPHSFSRMRMVSSMWVNPNNINHILAGSNSGGLYQTYDNGVNWNCITNNISYPYLGVRDIIVDKNNRYVFASGTAAASSGLFRSPNSGLNWEKIDLTFKPENGNITSCLRLWPGSTVNNNEYVYAFNNNNSAKLLKYTESTNSINQIIFNDLNLTNFKITDVEYSKTQINDLLFTAENKSTKKSVLQLSHDNGASWQNKTFELEKKPDDVPSNYKILVTSPKIHTNNLGFFIFCNQVWFDDVNNDDALNSGENQLINHLILHSIDNGYTWTSTHSTGYVSLSDFQFVINELNKNIIYIGQDQGVLYKSINGGQTFFTISEYLPNNFHADIRSLLIYTSSATGNEDVVFVGNDGGICKTSTGGRYTNPQEGYDWQVLNGNGLTITEFYGLGTLKENEMEVVAGAQDVGIWKFDNGNIKNKNRTDNYDAEMDEVNHDFVLTSRNSGSDDVTVSMYNFNSTFEHSTNEFTNLNMKHLLKSLTITKHPDGTIYFADRNVLKISNATTATIAKNYISNLPPIVHLGNSNNPKISSLSFCKKNPNNLYVARAFKYWGSFNPKENILFKGVYDSNSQSWTFNDITKNNLPFDYSTCTSIASHEVNPEYAFACFGEFWDHPGLGDVQKVYATFDGGNTWLNYSNGLPNIPCNKIKHIEGFGLVLATDYNVYYIPEDEILSGRIPTWQLLGNGLPSAIYNDIEYSRMLCGNSTRSILIRVSSYGKGIWNIEKEVPFDLFETEIVSSSQIWQTPQTLFKNILVENNSILTIKGNLTIGKGLKVEVKKGSKLILDGASIISYCGMWQGIIAEGDPTQPILPLNQPDPNHARVILKNNATIQYAEVGIDAQNGGFVAIDNSNFIDNRVALKFSNYPSGFTTNPLGGGGQFYPLPYNNPSYAKNTNFTTQTIYLGAGGLSGNPTTFISIERNKGLSFTNCQFKNLEELSSSISESQLGNGITATDAGYTVTNCEFYHLNYGVSNGNTYIASFFPTIRNSRFNENLRGLLLQGGDVAAVVSNTFTIEDLPVDVLDTKRYGLYLKGTHGYEVTNNVFRSLNGVSEGAGCIAWNTMRQSHFIKNNTFNNLTAGVISSGDNTSTSNPPKFFVPENYGTGLKVTCNTFNNTGTNIYVADGNNLNSQVINQAKGLSTFQGSCLNTGTTVNNLLDLNKNEVIFENNSVFRNLMYNEPVSNNQRYHLQSGKYTDGTMVSNGGAVKNVCLNLTQTINPPCLTKIYNPLCLSCMKFELNTANSTTKSMVELVDGNNTNGLIQTINDPLKSDVQVRNELLAVSPYLSDEVLLATLNKTTPLHHSFVKQVIISNSPVSENVRPTLYNSISGFPNGIKNQIISSQTGVSERTLLEAKVSQALAYQAEVIYDMARFYLTDSLSNGIDSVIALLEKSNNKVYYPWLTKLYIMKHDFVKADAILNDLQAQPEFQDFVKLMQIAKELEMFNRTCKDLTTIEKDKITNVSTGTCNYSKYNAEAWLKYYYNINGFVEAVELPTQSFARQAYNSTSDVSEYTENQKHIETNEIPYEKILSKYQTSHSGFEKEKAKYIQNFFFDFNPNPAKSEINLTFFAAENFKTASVEILDMQGKIVLTKDLSMENEQKLELSVETLKSGSYVCKLKVDKAIIETKQIIKQ